MFSQLVGNHPDETPLGMLKRIKVKEGRPIILIHRGGRLSPNGGGGGGRGLLNSSILATRLHE